MPVSTPPVQSRPWPWVSWAFGIIGNALLGCLAMFPFGILIFFLRGTVLNHLGWVDHPPSLRDNAYIAGWIGIGGTAFVLAIFVGYNKLVRSLSTVSAWPYWIVSTTLLFAPVILVYNWPELLAAH